MIYDSLGPIVDASIILGCSCSTTKMEQPKMRRLFIDAWKEDMLRQDVANRPLFLLLVVVGNAWIFQEQ